jgi:uncharacterized protein (DUF362 family)
LSFPGLTGPECFRDRKALAARLSLSSRVVSGETLGMTDKAVVCDFTSDRISNYQRDLNIPMELKRRNFLYLLGTLAAIGLTGAFDALKGLLRTPKGRREPRYRKNLFVADGKSLVAIVGGKNIKRMIKESVSLIGGFDKVGIKGKTILVKPNVVSERRNPTTTNPEVVKALVSILYEEGASEVFVGDMSALWKLPTKRNMEKTGIKKAAEEAGAKVVYFEDYDFFNINLPKGKYINDVGVSEWIFKVDRVINLPVIKTHRSATYTICLKNFIGATHFRQRPYFVDSGHWEEVVSEINMAYSPDLNVVDSTKIMVEGGPWKGQEKDTNLIVSSGDRIAADVIGLGMIKAFGLSKKISSENVWEQRQIKRAVEIGLGARNRDEIKLLTASLDGNKEFEELIRKVTENIR